MRVLSLCYHAGGSAGRRVTFRRNLRTLSGKKGGEALVIGNPTYNLALQLTQHLKSLWRLKERYRGDAAGCKKCQEIWNAVEEDLQRHVTVLKGELKNHLDAE